MAFSESVKMNAHPLLKIEVTVKIDTTVGSVQEICHEYLELWAAGFTSEYYDKFLDRIL